MVIKNSNQTAQSNTTTPLTKTPNLKFKIQNSKLLKILGLNAETNSSLRSHLTKSALGTFLLKVSSVGLGFLTSLFLARMLGAKGYGAYAYAMAWVGLLGVPATLGFHQLLVRNVAIYHTQKKWGLLHGLLSFSNRLVLIASIILMTGAALLGWVLLSSKNNSSMLSALWIALLALPFLALTQLRQAAMRGFQQIIRGQLPEALIRPLLFLITVAGVYLFFRQYVSVPLVVAVNVVATIIAFAVGAYWLQKAIPNKAKTAKPQVEARVWVSSAVPLLLVAGIQMVNFQIDIILLGAFKDAQQVGVYAVVKRIADLISFPLLAVEISIAPSIASLYATGQIIRLQKMISKSAKLLLTISLPIAVLLITFNKPALSLFGSDFTKGAFALMVLSIGQLMNAAFGPVGQLAIHTRHEKGTAVVVGLGAMINVILNVFLIPRWGVVGAAVATTVSLISWNLLLTVFVYKQTGIVSTAFNFMKFDKEHNNE